LGTCVGSLTVMARVVTLLLLGALCVLTGSLIAYLLMFGFRGISGQAGMVELTPENWEKETAGKTVFVKFYAPWCGHCKAMKPDWDKLMRNWNTEARAGTSVIADVDCIGAGKDLCEEAGVESFPTLKWGDPAALEDYKGGRDYAALETFAKENLKPLCGVTNLHLCDESAKQRIQELLATPEAQLQGLIDGMKKEIEDAGQTFDEEVKKLQETFEQLQKTKQEEIARVKGSGLQLMQAVQSHAKQAKTEL